MTAVADAPLRQVVGAEQLLLEVAAVVPETADIRTLVLRRPDGPG